ncbi:MAG: hypothetical protein AB2A00_38980 [Myxococcota bacterium]
MLTVAIATEFDDYDAEVSRVLLEQALARSVVRWQTSIRFNGDKSVKKLAPLYVRRALAEGVRHFLFTIDNDGGQRRRPQHAPEHDEIAEAADERDGCRWCWISRAAQVDSPAVRCIAVPVQTMETWLLVARGEALSPSPEQCYHRPTLKKRFFGTPLPATDVRTRLAVDVIRQPHALHALRGLRSFQLFEAQLGIEGWRG